MRQFPANRIEVLTNLGRSNIKDINNFFSVYYVTGIIGYLELFTELKYL